MRLRIPDWCKQYTLSVNGTETKAPIEKGYAVLNGNWKEGDIIVAIDNKELETMNDLREYIYSKNPNDIVTLQIARGKINKTISIVLRKKIKISEGRHANNNFTDCEL